jgi:hypothetical protein
MAKSVCLPSALMGADSAGRVRTLAASEQPEQSGSSALHLIRGDSTVPTVASNSEVAEVAREVEDAPITDWLAKIDRDPLLLSPLFAALVQRAGQQDAHGCSGLADVCLKRRKRTRMDDQQLDRRGRFVDTLESEGVRHNLVTITATALKKRPRRCDEHREGGEMADTQRTSEKDSQLAHSARSGA